MYENNLIVSHGTSYTNNHAEEEILKWKALDKKIWI